MTPNYLRSIFTLGAVLEHKNALGFKAAQAMAISVAESVVSCCSDSPNLDQRYAASYAKELIVNASARGEAALQTQLLYIKGNLRYWRGDTARQTKRQLDQVLDMLR